MPNEVVRNGGGGGRRWWIYSKTFKRLLLSLTVCYSKRDLITHRFLYSQNGIVGSD
jgi:hypothetical protein